MDCLLSESDIKGAKARYDNFASKFEKHAEFFGTDRADEANLLFPWMLISGLDSSDPETEFVFQNEPWTCLISETYIDVDDAEFFAASVDLANNKIWGTLSASVWISPKTEAAHKDKFEQMISSLK